MERKILLVTGDGGECYETLYACHRLQEAGYVPVLAAPVRRALNLVMHDFDPGWDTYVERPGYRRNADIAFADVDTNAYEAILLLGGRAPEYLRNDMLLRRLVREFHSQGKGVFAICHGIQIVTAAGLAHGRNMTCYCHLRWEVEVCGGRFVAMPSVRDGNLVTAQTWQDHPWFFREVFAWLGGGVAEPQAATAMRA